MRDNSKAIEASNKKYFFICEFCKKEFFTRRSAFGYYVNRCCKNPNSIYKYYKKQCLMCGKEFETQHENRKFCCKHCSAIYPKNKSRVFTPEIKEKIRKKLKKEKNQQLKKNDKLKKKKVFYCKNCNKIISRRTTFGLCINCYHKNFPIEVREKLSKNCSKKKDFKIKEYTNEVFIGYIYSVTNLITGSIYVGQHFTKIQNIKKSYFGSGIYILRAIKKYGKENFKKEIIFQGNCTQSELDEVEKYYIWLAKHSGNHCYNIAKGGRGCTVG